MTRKATSKFSVTLDADKKQVVTCTDDSFIDRWMKHMEGAAKLIEFRGPDQLSRQEGLDLFTQLRAQIVSPVSVAFV